MYQKFGKINQSLLYLNNIGVKLNLLDSKLGLINRPSHICLECASKRQNISELNEEIDLLRLKNNSLLDQVQNYKENQ